MIEFDKTYTFLFLSSSSQRLGHSANRKYSITRADDKFLLPTTCTTSKTFYPENEIGRQPFKGDEFLGIRRVAIQHHHTAHGWGTAPSGNTASPGQMIEFDKTYTFPFLSSSSRRLPGNVLIRRLF